MDAAVYHEEFYHEGHDEHEGEEERIS